MRNLGVVEDAMNGKSNRSEPVGNDYYDEEGLLRCGVCNRKKETRLEGFYGGKGPIIVPCICDCRKKEMEEEEKRRKHEEEMRRIESLRASSLIESKFKEANLQNFQENEDNAKAYMLAKKYVDNFQDMFEKNQGILFWGVVGTGKSYTAACIANELLNKRVAVVMTSFVKILQDIQGGQVDEKQYIDKLNAARLLIIDDLGTERNTDYALEKVYNVIDSRYRAGKPLILTTNMTLREMQETTDIRYKRIYDRIFEMCFPFRFVGKSWREKEAARRFDEMKRLMEG